MKFRLVVALLSGALLLGGVACSSSSSEATCAEWRTIYDEGYSSGGGVGHKVIGQKCVRFGRETSQKKTATTPTTTKTILPAPDNAAIQAACKTEEEAYARSVDADETQYTQQAWMACLNRS